MDTGGEGGMERLKKGWRYEGIVCVFAWGAGVLYGVIRRCRHGREMD